MKKYGIFAALAIMALAVVLVVGCIAPVDTSNFKLPGSQTPSEPVADNPAPAVKGSVQLSFVTDTDTNARTTFRPAEPASSAAMVATFAEFKLDFVAYNDGSGPTTTDGTDTTTYRLLSAWNTGYTALTTPIPVDEGDYVSLTVTAYLVATSPSGTGSPTKPVARFVHAPTGGFSIGPLTTTIGIVLTPIIADADTSEIGTFTWDIDVTGVTEGVTSATVKIDAVSGSLPGATPTPATVTLVPGTGPGIGHYASTAGTQIELEPGYYWINFTMTAATATPTTRTFTHVLHVYQNQTTDVAFALTTGSFGYRVGSSHQGGLTYVHPGEYPVVLDPVPGGVLTAVNGAGDDDDPIVIGTGGTLAISIINTDDYDSVAWYLWEGPPSGTALATTEVSIAEVGPPAVIAGKTLTITPKAGSFTLPGVYRVIAVGYKGGIPESNEDAIYVEIAP